MKKKNIIKLSIIALFSMAFFACVDEPDDFKFPSDKYFYDIPDVPVTEDYVVGVLYSELTEGYWFESTNNIPDHSKPELYTGTPILGLLGDTIGKNGGYYIDEDFFVPLGDPTDVLGKQLAYGKQAGIDFFLVNWNGHGTDTLFMNFKNKWQPGDPKIAFIFDCSHLYNDKRNSKADSLHTDVYRTNGTIAVSPYGDGRGTKTTFLDQMDSLKSYFFDDKIYYKLPDGKPLLGLNRYERTRNIASTVDDIRNIVGNVYLITPTMQRENGFTSLGNLQNIYNTVQYSYKDENNITRKVTHDIYIFRENGDRYGATQMPFDAVYEPAMLTDNYNTHGYDNWKKNFFSLIDYNFKEWKSLLEAQGKDFITTAMPGFDNRARDSTSNQFIQARETDGALYKTYANVAKNNANKHRLIIINSWNNFRDGTGLEPTEEYGESYLNFTKQFFKKKIE